MTLTDRTFAQFDTHGANNDVVYDETFHEHARALLMPLRERLVATGWKATDVEEHSDYGVAFEVVDVSGTIWILLQVGDFWLLNLSRRLSFWDRVWRRENEREVDAAFVAAVDAALKECGATRLRWMNEAEFIASEAAAGEAMTSTADIRRQAERERGTHRDQP
jgi:hypothetical protein